MAELTIDLTYGNALFKAAEELKIVDVIEEEATAVEDVFKNEPKLYAIINDPVISAAEKKDVLAKVFEGRISQELLNFLYVLVDKGRTRHYSRMIKAFKELRNKEEGFAFGTVYSVQPLDEEQMEKLQKETENLIKSKVKLENEIDKSLIGGIKILIDGRIIDASLKKRLEDLGATIRS